MKSPETQLPASNNFQRQEFEQDPSPPLPWDHAAKIGRFLAERQVVLVSDEKTSKSAKRQARKAWKDLEKQYGRDTVAVMKRLNKHGGEGFRRFGTVETRLSV